MTDIPLPFLIGKKPVYDDTAFKEQSDNALRRLGYGVTQLPSTPFGMFLLPKLGADAYAGLVHGRPSTFTYPGVETATNVVHAVDDWGRDLTGTKPSAGLIDNLLEASAQSMIPYGATRAVVDRAPRLLRPLVTMATPIAAKTPLGKVAEIGIFGGGAAAARQVMGVDTAQAETIPIQPNETEGPALEMSAENIPPAPLHKPDMDVQPGEQLMDASVYLPADATTETATPTLSPDFVSENVFTNGLAPGEQLVEEAPMTVPERAASWFDMIETDTKATMVAGATVAGILAVLGGKAALARRAVDIAQESGGLAGEATVMHTGSKGARAVQALADKTATMEQAFERMAPQQGILTDFKNLLYATSNPAALGGAVRSTLRGELPDGVRMQTSMQTFGNKMALWAKEAPDDFQGFIRAKLAANELENRTMRPNYVARDVDGVTPADLQRDAALLQSNPQYAQFDAMYRSITNDYIDFLARPDQFGNAGPITAAEAQRLKEFRYYVPEVEAERRAFGDELAARFGAGRLWQGLTGRTGYNFQGFASLLKREGGSTERLVNPIDALASYTNQMIRFKYENALRGKFVQAYEDAATAGTLPRDLKGLIRPMKENTDGPDIIHVMRGNTTKSFRVRDPVIAQALQANPQIIAPILNATRQVFQSSITGLGAPWFALKSLLYDVQSLTMLAEPGKHASPLKHIPRVGDTLARLDPLSTLTSSLYGVARGMQGKLLNAVSQGVNESIAQNGVLTKLFNPQQLQAVADWASTGMNAQLVRLLESRGVLAAGKYTQDLRIVNHVSSLKDVAPDYGSRFPAAQKIFDMYRGTFELISNGAKIAYAARQYKPNMTMRQIESLMRDAGTVTGRYYARPGGTLSKAASEAIPYYNVSVQGIRREFSFLRNHPVLFTSGLAGAVVLPAIASLTSATLAGPDALDDLLSGDPSRMGSTMRFYWPGTDKVSEIPLWQTFSPVYVYTLRTLAAAFGMHNKEIYSNEQGAGVIASLGRMVGLEDDAGQQAFAEAVKRALPAYGSAPPIVGAAAALAGYRLNTSNYVSLSENRGQDPSGLDNNALTGRFGEDDIFLPRNVEAVVEAAIGDAGRLGVGLWRSFDQGIRDPLNDTVKNKLQNAGTRTFEFGEQFMGDRVRSLSGLWNHTPRVGTTTPDTETLRNKLDGVKAARNWKTIDNKQGFIGSTQAANYNNSPYTKKFMPPDLAPIIEAAAGAGSAADRYVQDIAVTRKYINDVTADPSKGAEEKRKLTNQASLHINLYQRQALDIIRDAEFIMSQRTGRKIDFARLRDAKSITDFPVYED